MVERTEVEKQLRYLVALDVVWRVMSSLDGKGKRKRENLSKDIASLLKEGEEIGERVFAKIEKKDEEKARTLREGIDAFKKEYPKYGDILEEIIQKKRMKSNKYLIYGLKEGYKLGEEDYMRVMMDLGFERREAASTYPHLIAISERLEKANEQAERSILVSKS